MVSSNLIDQNESNEIPRFASVVVIGGGIMGCSTLYHLTKCGVSDAVLLERNQLTSGTTWHSAAQVRALRSTKNLTELIQYSIYLYQNLIKETGQHTGWIGKGSLSIATNEDRLIHIRRQKALATAFGIQTDLISAGQAKEIWPLMNADDILGAVWSPDDGRVSPSDLCLSLIRGATANGARVFENQPVAGIVTKGNRVVAVETEQTMVRCDAVVLCTGLWSRKNAASVGVCAPVWPCEHFYLLTKGLSEIKDNLPTLSDHDSGLYIRDDSGGLLVGCFEPMGKSISPRQIGSNFAFQLLDEDWDHFEPIMAKAMHRLPILENAKIKMLLNGPESFTPDGNFILGESCETKGLFLGCGMNSVGVASGGGAGLALANCIVHGKMPKSLIEVEPSRFPLSFNSVKALCQRVPEVLGKHYEISYPGAQFETARFLKESSLTPSWKQLNARFGQIFGWERPLYFNCKAEPQLTFGRPEWFEQVGQEVKAAHEGTAVFDQSTLGKILVSGEDAEKVLNRICANNLAQRPGRIIYTTMLNQDGGIESDLTVMRLSNYEYLLYVGTSAIRKICAWMSAHITNSDRVSIKDVTDNWMTLGLMGPQSAAVAKLAGIKGLEQFRYYEFGEVRFGNNTLTAARLSYVGEFGWEFSCHPADAEDLWNALNRNGAKAAGLYAQTSMRIEKRFLSYGADIDADINPIQCGLGFTVDWKSSFIGKEALLDLKKQESEKIIVTIELDDADKFLLGNEPVYSKGKLVGMVTSASYGYRVGKHLALAYIDSKVAKCTEQPKVQFNIAGELCDGSVSLKPAFDPLGVRMRLA